MTMKVLVIGGGGREHAIAWKLAQSPKLGKLLAHPLNGGLADLTEPAEMPAGASPEEIAKYADRAGIDLTVVGPEAMLCAGIADLFQERGLRIFGPDRAAARIEGSKVWTKEFLKKYRVPAARDAIFDDYSNALNYVMEHDYPVVIKADGLAAGKGVTVARTPKEARDALKAILVDKVFGAAGQRVVVEECLVGQEVSLLALTDGEHLLPLLAAQDHKPLLDGDRGPNTGGMGAICPTPLVTEAIRQRVMDEILEPVLKGFLAEGIKYTGVLYAGLMMTAEGPKVLEFNCRFGDPEAQAVLPLLDTDLLHLMLSTLDGTLHRSHVDWRDGKTCVSVVMASGGYPGKYEKQIPIKGLNAFDPRDRDLIVFHAGTQRIGRDVVTSGGRVLNVTAVGDSPADARGRAYEAVGKIHFAGAQYRKDIGAKALA